MPSNYYMKKLLIHVGPHKTASTFFQKVIFTRENGFNLLNNYKCPEDDVVMRYLISGRDKEIALNVLETRLDSCLVNIISSERLSGHPHSYWSDAVDIFHRLSKLPYDISYIFVSRTDSQWIKSVYSQLLKQGYKESWSYWHNYNWQSSYLIFPLDRTMIALEELYVSSKRPVHRLDFGLIQERNDYVRDFFHDHFGLTLNYENQRINSRKVERFLPWIILNRLRISRYNSYGVISQFTYKLIRRFLL